MANTLYNKSSRTQIYKTLPSNDVGFDGDIILSQIQGRGVYLCSKVNGRWHVSSKMEELRKIENTSTKDLITNKLTVIDNLDIVRISEIASDTDKFLMLDGNTVKFVTGANLLSYSGGQTALTFGIANTNAVKIDAADVADDDYARFTANGLEGRTLAEIKSDIGTGNSALVPSAGTSGHFLKHDGTFGQVAYSNLSGTPSLVTSLNDLSDVTYSSGDLTITSLDKIISGSLEFDSSGDITLDSDSGNIYFKDGGSLRVSFQGSAMLVGQTMVADANIQHDGDDVINFNSNGVVDFPGHTYFSEKSSAEADIAGKGQLWVKNDTPNNLYFTNDAGNDVQITNGASLAGGGGSSGLNSIIAAMVFG